MNTYTNNLKIKKATKLFVLSLTSLILINCGGGSSSDNALSTNGQEARGKQVINGDSIDDLNPAGVLRGRIFNSDQAQFQQAVNSFLSPQLESSKIGTVEGAFNSSETGISFWGRGITLNTGAPLINAGQALPNGQGLFNIETAELRISVYQKISDGQVEEVPVHFNSSLGNSGQLIDSVIQGDQVELAFADSFGKVALRGQIVTGQDGNIYYEGVLDFRNLKNVSGQAVSSSVESLGYFRVPACGFFQCSN